MVLAFLSLIKNAESITFQCLFFFLDNLAAIQTLPALKIYEVVEK